MKVRFLVPGLWSDTLGATRVVVRIAAELERMGVTTAHHCFMPWGHGKLHYGLVRRSEKVRTILGWTMARRVQRWWQQREPSDDIIDAFPGMVTWPLSQTPQAPRLVMRSQGCIWLYHAADRRRAVQSGLATKPESWSNALRARRMDQAWLDSLIAADAVIVHGETERQFLAPLVPGRAESLFTVPPGLDAESVAALAGLPTPAADAPCLGFLGTWDSRKGKDAVVAAFRALRVDYPSLRLRLLGTAWPEAQVRADFTADEQGALEVVPHFKRGGLAALLTGVTAGLFPSEAEGFGIGAIELAAAGIPVVGYDTVGFRDWAPEEWRVPLDDVSRLTAVVGAWLAHPEKRAQAATVARKNALAFSWERAAQETLAVYQAVREGTR